MSRFRQSAPHAGGGRRTLAGHAGFLAGDGTPFATGTLVPGGVLVGGRFYASPELEVARAAGIGPVVAAAVDPTDPRFALAVLPAGFRLVRAEAVPTSDRHGRKNGGAAGEGVPTGRAGVR